jgi:hypothetical protein
MVLWCAKISTSEPELIYQPAETGPQDTELHLHSVNVVPKHNCNLYTLFAAPQHYPKTGPTHRMPDGCFSLTVAKPGSDAFFIVCQLDAMYLRSNVELVCEPGTKFRLEVPEKYSLLLSDGEPFEVHLLGSERPADWGTSTGAL